uniref:G_PROTEIN_RECEP_F3_4 domain-containing protein n=1 Tax=Wuchereria bancrofti TaxID=6293 RepID=A0A1I8EGV1_WUCBA
MGMKFWAIQMTSLCMCISMSGTVALCCFFAPKVYIAVCQPYKNVRMRQSAVGHLVNQQMKFMRTSAEKNSITSSQISQQYGTIAPVILMKSSAKCNANSDDSDIIRRSSNSNDHQNSSLIKTTAFFHHSSNNMLHSNDKLAKETIMYQNNTELFFEQLFVNCDREKKVEIN